MRRYVFVFVLCFVFNWNKYHNSKIYYSWTMIKYVKWITVALVIAEKNLSQIDCDVTSLLSLIRFDWMFCLILFVILFYCLAEVWNQYYWCRLFTIDYTNNQLKCMYVWNNYTNKISIVPAITFVICHIFSLERVSYSLPHCGAA